VGQDNRIENLANVHVVVELGKGGFAVTERISCLLPDAMERRAKTKNKA